MEKFGVKEPIKRYIGVKRISQQLGYEVIKYMGIKPIDFSGYTGVEVEAMFYQVVMI